MTAQDHEPRTFVTSRNWSVDDEPDPDDPVLDVWQHADAVDLIRALCDVAGDEPQVLAVIGRHAQEVGNDRARRGLAAALYVTFAECMTHPAPSDHPVLVPIPPAEEPHQ